MSPAPGPPDPGRLNADRCRRLIGTGGVGRVVFTQAALPAVATMNFVVHASRLYFRTAADTALARSVTDAVVAFNVDHRPPPAPGTEPGTEPGVEAGVETGWSVTVTGRCRRLDDPPPEVREALRTWAPGVRETFFALDLALLSGHRTPDG
ncbi:pyridoxamine 5'-phosphate oxidase family protein [Kineococcus sp. LSe6-4]|uniref:Pyridoxamine 5'-phosphate oxidase family protein n=1 Tax=Kineococcus halophytocola TaxID=3234027 RepID=A0ABV4H1M6_9ACTN